MAALLGALPLMLGTGTARAAPSAGHHHRRRPDRQPDADAVHHAGDLSRVRPAGAARARGVAAGAAPAGSAVPDRSAGHEPLGAVHRAAGRDHAADARRRAGGRDRLLGCCRSRRCRRSISRPSRFRRRCPGPARRRWRPPSPRRSSASSASIAGVTEMTSHRARWARRASRCSSTSIRDIDGAARDVQAAINAARADLPTSLPSNPTYRKVNPADAPILILALTSDDADAGPDLRRGLQRSCSRSCRRSRASAQVSVGGSSLPAVRVELNPHALIKYGIGLEDVRAALASANANCAQGRDRGRRPALPDLRQRPGADAPTNTRR